ncbi:hypothetical protein ACFVWF_32975 [Rhodococcus qingshengii]
MSTLPGTVPDWGSFSELIETNLFEYCPLTIAPLLNQTVAEPL